ncbi:hypothetical protein [Gramella sp. MAR_2010_147]|uniref:hypothetical protein n=1 Tax=Gramella sp. MAR_2010_147 TaxID=1250205 RepID=UPI000879D07A|nr:hypothetical protein [Gramella sp. MAR_2010_147]SDS31323.1 hypothetical protein SAMN04488553_1971 [Gramella sp. MAR_2010_147]
MRSFKITLRAYARYLSVLIIFQSCSIYYSGNISLEKASETNRKVRVTTNSGEKLRFKWIEAVGENYYGFTRENSGSFKSLQKLGVTGRDSGKFYRFGLETLQIDKIQAKNYSASTIATVVISIVGLLAVLVTIAAATWNVGFAAW